LVLADDFVERSRPQAGSQGSVLAQALGRRRAEQIVAHIVLSTSS
jgi:hypothetical protein